MATKALARRHRSRFPHSLDRAPVLLPTDDTAIRRQLDRWFEAHTVRPVLVGEFEDYALLAAFGQTDLGIFPVLTILEAQYIRLYGVQRVGRAEGVRASYYAISVERRLKHPAVLAISERARRHLLEERTEPPAPEALPPCYRHPLAWDPLPLRSLRSSPVGLRRRTGPTKSVAVSV